MLSPLNNTFVRNVSQVAAGTAAAQAVSIAFSPIITRLYGPEVYGIYGVFVAGTAILTIISTMTYEVAIALPEKDDDAKAVVALSFLLSAAFSLLMAVFLLIFKGPIISFLQLERISSYILLIPILVFFTSCQKIAMQWMIRTRQFGKTAKVAVAQALIVNSAKSGAGLLYPAAAVLVGVATLGQAMHALMLSWKSKKGQGENRAEQSHNQFRPAKKKLIEVAGRYRDFPTWRAPQKIINGLTKQLPVLIFAGLFGPVYAGFYAIGQKVIKNPGRIISESVGNVFYPHIIKAFHQGRNIRLLLIKAVAGIACVGIVPYLIIIFFAPPLFGFVFGDEWTTAGQYAGWLAVWLFFDFIKTPVTKTIPVIQIQGFFLAYSVIASLSRVSTLFLGAIILQDDLLTIACFSIVSAFFSALLIVIVILKCDNQIIEPRQ